MEKYNYTAKLIFPVIPGERDSMRLIDADKFKQQVAAQAFTGSIPVEKANMLCNLIDMQPTENTGQWSESASDNTEYVLAYSDGIYCVTDQYGNVVCELIREN